MDKLFRWGVIVGVLVLSGVWLFYGNLQTTNLKLGLDLVGGAQLIFRAEPSKQTPTIDDEVMKSLTRVFENRINSSGTAEASVVQVGDDRIMVEIPGVDPALVKRRLLKTAKLEFKERNPKFVPPPPLADVPPSGLEKQIMTEPEWIDTGITGSDLRRAQAGATERGEWAIFFEMKPEGAKKLGDLTGRLLKGNAQMAIFLDDILLSAPRVQGQISDSGQISGDFSAAEANDLAVQLNAGALPVPVKLIAERTVGATLGQESIQKSLKAGFIGLALVGVFMVVVFRLPGLAATLALLAYTLISLGIFTKGVTLTLAGIAGFILSIGMAVDANVLIFERIREEMQLGRSVYKSVEDGFSKAFPSILDSNLNTLIVCAILYIFGSDIGLVKGFAVTLAIGVAVSFFSAIFITRELMNLILNFEFWRRPFWFRA